ncbi:hypothetical protein GCM10025864_24420 [Luteimicrobium album]|uniref:SEC-C motif-containing protein n=1 Tax=Luteimicrobium album TaxID=1054550 RepID=A0ABQ6I3Z2_9MICO|nr:SEC-C domain-containing protein [Luteimicrobium album]GMA24683.1 hypothetical protein GCM10025864_24420 [Luteimicrobium album]
MTYIAIHTSKTAARISTDSWTYNTTATRLGHSSKVHAIPHLRTVLTGSGPVGFLATFGAFVEAQSTDSTTFEDLLVALRDVLPECWATYPDDQKDVGAIVILVGWFAAESRYAAAAFSSFDGFQGEELDDFFVIPSPAGMKISDVELARIDSYVADDRLLRDDSPLTADEKAAKRATAAANRDVLIGWTDSPTAPTTTAGWIDLAESARLFRSRRCTVGSSLKVLVGGDLWLTTINSDGIATKKIHAFNDSGAEFAEVMAGGLHPQVQLGPCRCGSGKTYLECCLVPELDEPCPCESGKTLRQCCAVDAARQVVPAS